MFQMSSSLNTFTKLNKITAHFFEFIPKPSQYNDSTFIISSDYNEGVNYIMIPGIYQYNINNNKIDLIDNPHFRPSCHGQFIDIENDTFYVFNDIYSIFCALNLKTKKIIYDKFNKKYNCSNYPSTIHIPSPINQIHILDSNGDHFKFKCNNNKLIKLNKLKYNNIIENAKILYIESTKKLMIIGGHFNNECYCCCSWFINNFY